MFKKIKTITESAIMVFLLIVSGLVISPILPIKNVPKIYTIISPSMEPTIKTGSIVITTAINPEQIQVGDVVAFQSPADANLIIMHRTTGISATKPTTLTTKGDNNSTTDNWTIFSSAVVGKEILSIPYLGYFTLFVKKPLGFGLMIVVPALLFVILQIFDIKKAVSEEVEKKVNERLAGRNRKDTITQLMAILLTIGFTISLGTIQTAHALFKSNARVTGLSLYAADHIDEDEEECDKHDKDKKDKDNNKDGDKDKDEHENGKDHDKKDKDKCKENQGDKDEDGNEDEDENDKENGSENRDKDETLENIEEESKESSPSEL